MEKLVICLTGGIASGKTAVSNRLSELGLEIIDADIVARKIVEKDSEGLQALVKYFGLGILSGEGQLDRKKFRSLLFNDDAKRLKANDILHPLIRVHMREQVLQSDSSIIVVVIPLYSSASGSEFETISFDRVLVIDVSEETQLKRLLSRDRITEKLAKNMLAAQIGRKERLALADDVVNNNGTLDQLNTKVSLLVKMYVALLRKG